MVSLFAENIPFAIAGVMGLFAVVLGYVSIIENLRDRRESRNSQG